MDPSDQNFTLDDFMRWKVEALREYLTKRGLTRDGTKNELAALCFAANAMHMPLVPSQSEIVIKNKADYKKLLCVDGDTIPDPLNLFSGWLDEKNGLRRWPPIFISDIINFMVNRDTKGTIQAHLGEYKIGKAYEYFQAGFLKEVFYHQISEKSSYCILRARCTPSTKITDDWHNVWVCAEKTSGEIKSAYCTCTAGLGSTCNHVAGLLFRVESANKLGVTSSTSAQCTWKVPSGTTALGPPKLKDMKIKKSRHGKLDTRRLIRQTEYKPVSSVNKSDLLQQFATGLKEVLPNACIFKGVDLEDTTTMTKSVPTKKNENFINPNLYTISHLTNLHTDPATFLQNLPQYNHVDIQRLSESTVGQWKNPAWHLLRKDRLTASNFYSIHTRVTTSKTKQDTDFSILLSKVLGYMPPNPQIKALKHGRECEPYAKKQYQAEMLKHHHGFKTSECGLYIDKKYVYLGASPDLLVSCSCCGDGLVEIKCPVVAKCEKCAHFCFCSPPQCLERSDDGTFSLKMKHSYFCQIMGQLAITDRTYCDFFIYTCNGTFRQRINFNERYYADIIESLTFFYNKFVADELYSRKVKNSLENEDSVQHDVLMDFQSTYFCPVCNNIIKESDEIKTFQDQSISCDKCELWFHFKCVELTKLKAKQIQQWTCKQCINDK